ncbi:PQQ-dependent sugar dehydrogenase [Leucobacter sp. NPDC077196]|uniref:PQQ-dependent sugar dehydrogenase n=1 Tax=Leucobacter sp. NPDC077196 TaxID=3154959 RepID=UPI00341DDEC8
MLMHRRTALAAVCVAIALLAGCTDAQSDAPEGSPPSQQSIVAGLDAPWSIAFVGATPIVSERDSGRIVSIDADGAMTELVTITGLRQGGEGGLLGLAANERALYAYATMDDENRILRFALLEGEDGVALGDPEVVLDGIPAAGNHNGGRLAFGPDGMLYATTGDAGAPEAAQDPDSLAGKILRMEPDGASPDDNPYPESPVWSLGHRNPQGIAWAPDGTMLASEFGQNTWDELNVIEPGANYGWPEVEGAAEDPEFVDPVQQWQPAEASPSGIAVHSGSVWIANLRGESIREVPLDDLTASNLHEAGALGRVRDVVIAPSGELWAMTNNTDGRGAPRDGDDRIVVLQ